MDHPDIKLKWTKKFGKGVYATKDIGKGTLICSFDGPVYDKDYEPWTDDLYNHTIQFGPGLWRDSKGIARYLNHSCEPNCGIKNFFDIVAMRDIKAGEQITWDYEMTEKNPTWRMKCQCGSSICRKKIGHFKFMPNEVRQKYKGFLSDWLIKKSFKKIDLKAK